MNWLRRWFQTPSDGDLEDELAAHLALKAGRLGDAREARLALGNPAVYREDMRAVWRWRWLDQLSRDVAYSARTLRRELVFTVVVVVSLALGIGANTAVFSLFNGLLLRALPVRAPEQLRRVVLTNLPPNERFWANGREIAVRERDRFSYAQFEAMQERAEFFDGVAGFAGLSTISMDAGGTPRQVTASNVTGSYFPVLGVPPLAGRMLAPADDQPGAAGAAVIGEDLWESMFGRSPDAIGRAITVERAPFTIAGVAPRRFTGVQPGVKIELWLPYSAMDVMYPRFSWRNDRNQLALRLIARLRAEPGPASPRILEAALPPGLDEKSKAAQLAMRIETRSARSGTSWVADSYGEALTILLVAVFAVLLISATNVTNLVLARAARRAHEVALRVALGASRWDIYRQLLVESALLAGVGAIAGLAIAKWLAAALQAGISGGDQLVVIDGSADWRAGLFLAAVLFVVVLVIGLAPAWTTIRASAGGRGSTQAGSKLRGGLIVLQTAMAFALLGGAGLLLLSLRAMFDETTGYSGRQVLFLTPDLLNAGIDRPQQRAAYERILEETRRLPGVDSAAWLSTVPLRNGMRMVTVEAPGKMDLPVKERMFRVQSVTDGYFETMGMGLLAGVDFAARGGRSGGCILSENAARFLFGGVHEALGKQVRQHGGEWMEVIGIAPNAKIQNIRESASPILYLALRDSDMWPGMSLAIRPSGAPGALQKAMDGIFAGVAGRAVRVEARTLEGNIAGTVRVESLIAWLLGGFGAFAVLIVVSGLAGMLAYDVEQRRREIGVRLAVGASQRAIRSLFELQGLRLVGLGLACGGGLCVVFRRVLDAYLFRTSPDDPRVWAALSVFLMAAGFAAAAIPAWRASRIDPMEALRRE
jgi:predicted permease